MARPSFGLFYLAVIAAGAWLGADITNRLLWPKLEATLRAQQRTSRQNPGDAVPPPRNDSQDSHPDDPILSGRLFRSDAPGQTGGAALSTLPSPPPLDFVLLGTIVGQNQKEQRSYAIMEQTKTKEQRLYRQGDRLSDDARMGKIHRNKVVIHRNNVQETLEVLFVDEVPPVAVPASFKTPSGNGDGIRQVSKDRYVLDRREVNEATENLPKLLTKARIVPNFTDGSPDGFRIFAINKDSLYAKIGLQNGDVVHRVNDIEVKDPQNFLQVFQQLKDESNIRVDLVRNNQKETFSYEIR